MWYERTKRRDNNRRESKKKKLSKRRNIETESGIRERLVTGGKVQKIYETDGLQIEIDTKDTQNVSIQIVHRVLPIQVLLLKL